MNHKGTLSRRPGDTVEGFAQQFSVVQQQAKAIQHILPRRDAPSTTAPGARPQSARRRGRPPASSRAAPPQAESTLRLARRASRRRAVPPSVPARPQVVQEVDEVALTQATRRCWSLLFLRRRREQRCSFPRRRAGRRILCFCSATFSRKSNFLFLRILRSMGRQCATPCFLTLAHDPLLPAAKRVRFGDNVPPHAPLASPVWDPGRVW